MAAAEASPRLRDLTPWEKEECRLCTAGFLNLWIIHRMKFSRFISNLRSVLGFLPAEVRLVGFIKGLLVTALLTKGKQNRNEGSSETHLQKGSGANTISCTLQSSPSVVNYLPGLQQS